MRMEMKLIKHYLKLVNFILFRYCILEQKCLYTVTILIIKRITVLTF